MDESFDPSKAGVYKGVFVAGGIIGRGPALFELDRRWAILRRRPDIDIGYFKASQCELGSKQFSKFVANPKHLTEAEKKHLESISLEFVSLIPQVGFVVGHGIGIDQMLFYEIVKDAKALAVLGPSPYQLTYHLAMVQCAWFMKQLEENLKMQKSRTMDASSSRDFVSFVCDEDEEHGEFADRAYRELKKNNPNAAQYMATYSMANDKTCDVMQAADAVAFEIRRALHVHLGRFGGSLRKQFNLLTDTHKMGLIQELSREQLLNLVATHEPGEPFRLDSIMNQEFQENVQLSIPEVR